MNDSIPVHLRLEHEPVLVVDGSDLGAAACVGLTRAGARVTVVAPTVSATVEDLAERALVTWHPRAWELPDVAAARLVVGDPADGALADASRSSRSWVVSARDLGAANAPTAVDGVDPGEVVLVGGGPGDPGLLTAAATEALQSAEVVLYDRLAPVDAVTRLAPHAELIDVGKIPRGRSTAQEHINDLLVQHALAGRRVVRLKGGDPYVFGRGGEEAIACAEHGVQVRVIPGISSALAGPALAGIPLTHRGVAQGFTVVSGHLPPGHPDSSIDYAALARSGTTLVLLMAVANLDAIASALRAGGLPHDTPAATVADASLPSERVVRAPLGSLATVVAAAGLGAPAITVIGAVAGLTLTPQEQV